MTKAGRAAVAVILDKSGSMASVKEATISAYNEFLSDQKKVPGECFFWLTMFDTFVSERYAGVSIQEVPDLNALTYTPSGMTALYDAVGRTINSMGQHLAALPENERPERVLIVIQTDGQENSSREFNFDSIGEMIAHQTGVYNWDFLFLGADQDAWSAGMGRILGFDKTLSYAGDQTGVAMRAVSMYTTQYRTDGVASLTSNDLRNEPDHGATAQQP